MRWILHLRVTIIIFLAVVLISAAIMFSVLRALLPHATGYKAEIQQEISRQVGLPVEIENIDAAIHWFSPRLKLLKVSVFDTEHKVALFNFDEAFVELDTVASILHRDFIIDDVGLVGANISIEKFPDNEWSVQGIRFSAGGSGGLPDSFWYMLQNSNYLLHDSNIYYQDHTGNKLNLSLLNVNIDVENNFSNHDIRFSMQLPEAYGKELAVVADLYGDIASLDGDIYVEASRVKLQQWNKKFNLERQFPVDADLDIDLWLSIDDNAITSLTSQFKARDVSVKNAATSRQWQISELSSSLRCVIDEDGWNVAVADLVFGDDKKPLWPQPASIIVGDDGDNYHLSVDFLRLTDIQEMVAVIADKKQLPVVEQLKAYAPQGDIYNVELLLPKRASGKKFKEKFHLAATVSDLALKDKTHGLSLSGLDARLSIEHGEAVLDLISDDVLLELPELFRNPLLADTINGQVRLAADTVGWRISSDLLHLKNKHINTFSRFDIALRTPEDINIDAQTNFYNAYGKYAKDYLPVGVMSAALVEWLDMAVADGYVPSGQFILHGKASDFPYDGHQGIFQVMFAAEKLNMQFLPDWPLLSNAAASVKFENRSLFVRNATANTQAVNLFNGEVQIPDLTRAHLTVKTSARSKNEDVQTYIWTSPLDDVLGDAMRLFQFTGNSGLDLKLDVPLYEDDAETTIDGKLQFADTGIYYPALGYEISDINGMVKFTRDSITAEAMPARIKDEPVTISAFTREGSSGSEVVFHLDGKLQADYLLQHYDWVPKNWVEGESTWALDTEVPYQPKDYLVHVSATSFLQGVSLQLSDKVNKAADEKVRLSIGIDVLGKGGLYVDARADSVTVDAESEVASNIFEVHARRGDKALWDFDINSQYAQGKGSFTESLANDTLVNLDLKNIDLHALLYTEAQSGSEPLQPNTFPSLRLHFDQLLWDGWRFTDVNLETDWHEHGMLINKFALAGPAMTFRARGTWLTSWTGAQETVLLGSMTSQNIGTTLVDLGFERSIDRATYSASFNSIWPGAPYDLSLEKMKGKTSFNMKDGEILEVNPGAGGRLLGLMNIFKLASRLALDFDDVTRKGFSFDYINGEFNFSNGDGSLEKFDVSASAADVNMFGSIGLVKKDYGLLMQVKPHTDTLTFAGGTLLGGVAIGAGLALIQKVFDLGIIGNTVYSITGSWDDPKVEKIVERTLDSEDEEF